MNKKYQKPIINFLENIKCVRERIIYSGWKSYTSYDDIIESIERIYNDLIDSLNEICEEDD